MGGEYRFEKGDADSGLPATTASNNPVDLIYEVQIRQSITTVSHTHIVRYMMKVRNHAPTVLLPNNGSLY